MKYVLKDLCLCSREKEHREIESSSDRKPIHFYFKDRTSRDGSSSYLSRFTCILMLFPTYCQRQNIIGKEVYVHSVCKYRK